MSASPHITCIFNWTRKRDKHLPLEMLHSTDHQHYGLLIETVESNRSPMEIEGDFQELSEEADTLERSKRRNKNVAK